jgi:ubiquinone/menaquinone biosynthesis C-methylase UbiE
MVPGLWPAGFARVPDATWTALPIGALARKYDSVEQHGWYQNLEPTIDELRAILRDGDLVCDYSGGTGILAAWLFRACPELRAGVVIVDSSPKFLRLALEKLRDEERVAFRSIEYLREPRRLQRLDEALEPSLLARRLDALVSTNAVHLYYDLPETVASWVRVLRPGAPVLVQSGNIRNPEAAPGTWIIDETVEAIHEAAVELVRADPAWTAYRDGLDDEARMARYADLRRKYFLPVRPLDHYLAVFGAAGLTVERVVCRPIEARVVEWFEFLAAYHDGVLGWVGGTEKLEGAPPSTEAVRDRLALMRLALDRLFDRGDAFRASWTYLSCRTPSAG